MIRIQTAVLSLLALSLIPACVTSSPPAGELAFQRYELARLDGASREPAGILPPFGGSSSNTNALEEARSEESKRALETLWRVASTTAAQGAEWEFRFWSHGGALTLLSFHLTEEGEELLAPVSRRAFLPHLSRELPTLIGTQPREVTLTLEREEAGWSADLDTSSSETSPPHARTIPTARGGLSGEAHRHVLDTARRIARTMSVPRGGRVQLVARVSLEDDRVVGWEPEERNATGDGPALSANEATVTLIVGTLLPFTRGLGERTVSLSLEGAHRHGEAHPHWRIVTARVLEPPAPPKEVADFHKEYRALHEHILVEFQEQSRGYAVLAAGFTAEQIAYSIAGGLALKGAWVLVGKAAPTVVSILSKGGKAGVQWFRNLLVRAPSEERELLARLWLKAETQGLKSLTVAEKQVLQVLMGRLEKVLATPLDIEAKRSLRKLSRHEYFTLHNPRLAEALGTEGLQSYQVHHVYPLEYTHLFPKLDITGKANLTGLHEDVHRSVSAVWGIVRESGKRMQPQDVERVVETINRHYDRWFDKVYDMKDATALIRSEHLAMKEVAAIKAMLSP